MGKGWLIALCVAHQLLVGAADASVCGASTPNECYNNPNHLFYTVTDGTVVAPTDCCAVCAAEPSCRSWSHYYSGGKPFCQLFKTASGEHHGNCTSGQISKTPSAPANVALPWGPASCFVDATWSSEEVVVQNDIQYGAAYNYYESLDQADVKKGPIAVSQEKLLLDAYFPPSSDTRKTRPAMVIMHGGAFTEGNKKKDHNPEWATILAARGYVVVSIDYRLISKDDWSRVPEALLSAAPAMYASEDARAAVRFLRSKASEWRIDTTRIAVGGDSAGAIAALYYGYKKDAAEGSSGNSGYSSAVSAIMSISGEMKEQAYCKKILGALACLINSPPGPDDTSQLMKGDVPVVLLHGSADLKVPYKNGKAVSDRANSVGVRNEFITIDGAGHVPMHQCFDPNEPHLNQWLTFLSGALNLAQAQCPHKSTSGVLV